MSHRPVHTPMREINSHTVNSIPVQLRRAEGRGCVLPKPPTTLQAVLQGHTPPRPPLMSISADYLGNWEGGGWQQR